jgi:hypothetical protein
MRFPNRYSELQRLYCLRTNLANFHFSTGSNLAEPVNVPVGITVSGFQISSSMISIIVISLRKFIDAVVLIFQQINALDFRLQIIRIRSYRMEHFSKMIIRKASYYKFWI